MSWTAPDDQTIEVSVIGRGYGECIVVHLGCQDWLIVDSCTPSRSDRGSYALAYLSEMGIGPARVRWLFASHWHDDHVRGFAEAAERCAKATVFASEALLSQEFFALALSADDIPGALRPGPAEMRDTIKTLVASDRKIQLARADSRINADTINGVDRELWALSPSNAASLLSKQSFTTKILELEGGRAIPAPEENEVSVALHIRIGETAVLLGGDLQWHDDADRGWQAVLGSTGRPTELASLYKVAHHGADNADHDRIWEDLLERNPVALLTPYGHGRRPRPDEADVNRLRKRTDQAFLAGPERRPRRTTSNNTVEKLRRAATRNAVVSESPLGHVRARRALGSHGWSVELRGTAARL